MFSSYILLYKVYIYLYISRYANAINMIHDKLYYIFLYLISVYYYLSLTIYQILKCVYMNLKVFPYSISNSISIYIRASICILAVQI